MVLNLIGRGFAMSIVFLIRNRLAILLWVFFDLEVWRLANYGV